MVSTSIVEQIQKTIIKNLLAKEGENNDNVRKSELDKNLKFVEGIISYKNVDCGIYDEKKRIVTLDQERCLNHTGLNSITTHPSLPTNAKIIVKNGKNQHTIETDHLGRKIKITNEFREKNGDHVNGTRANDEQTKAKLYGDEDGYVDTHYKLKDQGGHGHAASAGGLKEMTYLFPQCYRVNNSIEWKQMENAQRAEYNSSTINFKTIIGFSYADSSNRPSKILSEVIGQFHNLSREFDNENIKPVIEKKLKKEFLINPLPKNGRKEEMRPSTKDGITKSSSGFFIGLPYKTISIALLLLLLLFLFVWLRGTFPFNSEVEQEIASNETNITIKTIDDSNNSSVKIKLGFAGPLEDLTKSITDMSEFNHLVDTQNVIPVIGSVFEHNSAEISKAGKHLLTLFIGKYNILDDKNRLLIEGFTCSLGSNNYNSNLGFERANVLKAELISLGVDEKLIKMESIGKKNFVSTSNFENDLILNRRSNVTIIGVE